MTLCLLILPRLELFKLFKQSSRRDSQFTCERNAACRENAKLVKIVIMQEVVMLLVRAVLLSLLIVGATSFNSPVHVLSVDRPMRRVVSAPLMVDEPRVGLWGRGEPPKCV